MTVHETIYNRHSRVPLPEIYSVIPEALPITYADEIEMPGVGVVSAFGKVEVNGLQSPPRSR